MQTPPSMIVASAASAMTPEDLARAVEESVNAEISSKPSPETRRSYEHAWRFYRTWVFAQPQPFALTDVRPRHVQKYLATLRDEEKAKGTISRAATVIRVLYGAVVRDELMLTNPAREVKGPKVDSQPNAPWIKEESDIEKLMNVHEGGTSWTERRDRLIIRMGLGLGWRRAEIARTAVEDIDGDVISAVVKGGKRESFGLPDFLAEEIFEWRQFAGIQDGTIFPRRADDRRPINGAVVYRVVRQSCALVGIAVVPPHALRRTAVTYLRENGVGLKPCQLMLAHAQESTTGRYDKQRDARANKPGELLGKLVHT